MVGLQLRCVFYCLASLAIKRPIRQYSRHHLSTSTKMPPAQALLASQPFSGVRIPALNLIYIATSFSFVFICGGFLACRSIARRRRPLHNSAPRFTNFGSQALLSNEMWRTKKRTSFSPAVSTLVTQSTVDASSPLRLKIIPYSSNASWSIDSLFHSLGRPLSWGWATIRLVRVVASSSAASIQQSFAGIKGPTASSCVGLSISDVSRRDGRVISLFPTLYRPRATIILKFLPSLRRQPIDFNGKEHTGSPWHLSDLEDPVTDKDGPEPDIRVPDRINVPQNFRSIHDDAEYKTEIPVIPLIILSLPSSEHLVDPPRPAHQDEHLLSPDGTFRSTGPRARITASTRDVSNATRVALASRLRERRKRPVMLTSPNVLANPSMAHWPRWF